MTSAMEMPKVARREILLSSVLMLLNRTVRESALYGLVFESRGIHLKPNIVPLKRLWFNSLRTGTIQASENYAQFLCHIY